MPLVAEQAGGEQLAGVGRRDVHEVDAPLGHVVDEGLRVEPGLLVDQVQFVSGDHHEDPLPRRVEGDRRGQRRPPAVLVRTGHDV